MPQPTPPDHAQEQPPPQPPRGPLRRFLRGIWIAFCTLTSAVIIGVLIGAWASNPWVGVAAALPGAALGWFFGRNVSPLEVLFPI